MSSLDRAEQAQAEFLETDHASDSAPLVAAIINDDLRELTYPIQMEARLAPVTMADCGWSAYLPAFLDLPS